MSVLLRRFLSSLSVCNYLTAEELSLIVRQDHQVVSNITVAEPMFLYVALVPGIKVVGGATLRAIGHAVARVEETVPGLLALSDKPRYIVWPPLRNNRQSSEAEGVEAVLPTGNTIAPALLAPVDPVGTQPAFVVHKRTQLPFQTRTRSELVLKEAAATSASGMSLTAVPPAAGS